MQRYNNTNRNDTFPQSAVLVDVSKSTVKPAYCKFESVVDKTFFRPGVSELAQLGSAGRVPRYDTVNGVLPDYGINIAWVRSPARDRVDIDSAQKMVENIIEAEKKDDLDAVKAKAQAKENAKFISDALKDSLASTSSDSSASE